MVLSRRRNCLIDHSAFRRLSSQRQTLRRVEPRGVDLRGAAFRLRRAHAPLQRLRVGDGPGQAARSKMLISISAWLGQLPCMGEKCRIIQKAVY
jgi:hypothetical protein